MWPMSEGDASLACFLVLLAILAAILWAAAPDEERTHEGFDPSEGDHGLR